MAYKVKVTKYSKDNILGWSEEDFRDVICQFCNVRILSGQPLTPLMNCYYLNESNQWHKERLKRLLSDKKQNKS